MKSGSTKEGPSITASGYSIFHETMADMKWVDIAKAAKNGAVILFPTAGITEHGPHMACSVDTYETYIWSKLIRRELEAGGIQTLIAPPFFWAVNERKISFPGSFSISPEVAKALFLDVLKNLDKWGFEDIIFLSWHGENEASIMNACKEARSDLGIKATFLLPAHRARPIYKITGEEEHIILMPSAENSKPRSKYSNIHAGGVEVGYMDAFFPDIVDHEILKTLEPTNITWEELLELESQPDELNKRMPDGYIGDPANYDTEGSKISFEDSAKRATVTIAAYLNGSYKTPKELKPYKPDAPE
jgi:creatinine amidohydrolase